MSGVALSVGVVTHDRSALFADMLGHLLTAVRHHDGPVSVIVVNNSGPPARAVVQGLIDRSGLARHGPVTLIDSPRNDIAVARNLVLEACETRLLAFIDDDEYPCAGWLAHLAAQQAESRCAAVAGPIVPVYPPGTPRWVRQVDLHNMHGHATGDTLRRAASGNCLLDLQRIGDDRFDVAFGLTGGEDADFFERLSRRGERLVWCAEARVEETITTERATARYTLSRFLMQGGSFARVMLRDATLATRAVFYARALVLAPVGILGGLLLWPFHPRRCARGWKGGFTNLGKLLGRRGARYGQPDDA